MNPNTLRPFLDASYISEQLNGVSFGVAGGLSAEVVHNELATLVKTYPNLS